MEIPQLIFNGLVIGSIIALTAVGLTLTYGILRLSNFAHADFMTLGAYLTWAAKIGGLNLWISMIIGAAGTIVAMIIAEYLLWKPMRDRRATSTTLIVISIGLALFIRNGILMIWGGNNQSYQLPLIPAQEFLGIKFERDRLIVIGLAVVAVTVLHFLLQETKLGKAMRAVADNIDLARVSGINVEKVVLWTWVITGGLTALGGAMYGLIYTIKPTMGWFLLLPMFASVILGGIGNPYGAIIGGLVVGIVQELSVSIPWLGSEYKLGVSLLIMIVILLIRPQGLFKGMM
ncbi:MAG: branched-chain amino acid ABC transporter permease [cyanobacterium endosymbiont of Rhopalodia musculus]|uniref:branched-chain amino acid ABC transporter permease n=1 Tax=cyanobacterium endosymbiont of Epithemia clementina EcSB TaxID=3034674 RepID=UPI0024812E41|nr:branched-chain amino acid ABC transporter permease [cyanobacterium endosymbiont of Epithemia clementina EcSB]WGT66778.1 branched-chain amino acid ABC transporter permease [cyanobacterium endosymbiont of Epithemia clementina EcSB]